MKKYILLSVILLALFSADVHAGKRYWVGGTANWNVAGNWSTTSGGGGGAGVPGSSDTAFFDTGGVTCTMNANGNIKRLDISNGTLVQSTFSLTIGTGGATLSGGTFTGGSGSITVSGAFTISGCAFTSTSGVLTTNSNFTVSNGSFTHNSGTISINASMTLTSSITGGTTFNHLYFGPSAANATITVTSTTAINMAGTLYIAGTKTTVFNTGTINIQGNINTASATAPGGGGTGTFNVNGSAAQSVTGNATGGDGRLPNFTVNKSGDTLYLYDVISTAGNWTYTAGNVKEGGSVVSMAGSPTISGGPTFSGLWFASSGTFTIVSGTVTVKATLGWGGGGSACPIINTGTIYAQGNIDMSFNTQTSGSGGTGTIVINGTGNQTLKGSVSGSGRMCNVQINKSTGTLTLTDYIQPMKDWTYTSGAISATGSTVAFVGTKTISGSHKLNNVSFDGSGASTYTITGYTDTVADINFTGSAAITMTGGTLKCSGNITTTNSSTSTTGTTTIVINGTANQTLTGSGTAGAGKLPNITIDKTSDTVKLASIISCTGDWIYTQGIVSPGTSTVAFYGSFNLDGQASGSSACMPFYNVTINGNTRTLTGDVDCNNNFTISSGTTCSAGSKKIYVGGNWNSAGTWTYGTSTVVFDGHDYNKIEGAAGTINFANVELSRNTVLGTPSKNVRLLNPVKINTGMTFNIGRVKTDTTNYLEFADNATCTVTNDDSAYVCGAVRKVGDDAFTFPMGDTVLPDSIAYHPLSITAPSSSTDRYMAMYSATGQSLGSTLVDTLDEISNCEYWTIRRQNGSSNVYVKVYWNQNSCGVDNYDDLRLAGWLNSGSKWIGLGVSDLTPGFPTGGLRTGAVVNFGTQATWNIVIGQRPNSDAYAVLKKKLDAGYYQCSNGKLMFRFQDEYNDPDAKLAFRIYNDQYGLMTSDQLISSGYVPNVYYGSNYYLLNVLDCNVGNGNVGNGFFILEVINEKNEHWFLRFKHTTTLTPNCVGNGGETE